MPTYLDQRYVHFTTDDRGLLLRAQVPQFKMGRQPVRDPGAHLQMYSTSKGSSRSHSQMCNTNTPSTWLLVTCISGSTNDVQERTLHKNWETGGKVPGCVISDMFAQVAVVMEGGFLASSVGYIKREAGYLRVGRKRTITQIQQPSRVNNI